MIWTKIDSHYVGHNFSFITYIHCTQAVLVQYIWRIISYLSVTEAQKQQQKKRNCCSQVHFFVWRCWTLELTLFEGFTGLTEDWCWSPVGAELLFSAVRVCVYTEISSRCSMGSVLDTQLMGLPSPPLEHCRYTRIILFWRITVKTGCCRLA